MTTIFLKRVREIRYLISIVMTMPLHLRDGIFVSLDHVIGFTKLFQESNEVLLRFTLELTHKRLKLIFLLIRPLTFINAIRQRRISNDGGFDVGGYLVSGFSHEALGGDVVVGRIKEGHPWS